MDKREKSGGPDGLTENSSYGPALNIIRDGLIRIIMEIKAHKATFPYLREMIVINIRIPKSMLRYRNEFTFNQIESGVGVVKRLEEGVVSLEKHERMSSIVLEAYLYPYEQEGGRRLLGKILKYALSPAPSLKSTPLPLEKKAVTQTVVVETRQGTRDEIEKQVVEIELPVESEAIAITETPATNVMAEVPLIEEVVTPMEKHETAILQNDSKNAGVPELGEILVELLAQRERNANRVSAQLTRTEDFFQEPINFDYRKWNLWSTDGTRGILRRTFREHGLVSPADLMKFLGTNDPTLLEWNDFIARLNGHNSSVKLVVGASSEDSLKRWMRKQKMIPESFRKN